MSYNYSMTTLSPLQILNLLTAARDAMRAYTPVNPPYASAVSAYYNSGADDVDRSIEKVNLAQIMDTGGFLPPPAGFGV